MNGITDQLDQLWINFQRYLIYSHVRKGRNTVHFSWIKLTIFQMWVHKTISRNSLHICFLAYLKMLINCT